MMTSDARRVEERLAAHVTGLRFEDLPTDVVEKSKDLLANHLGLAFEGALSDSARRAVRMAYELSAGAGDGVVIGERGPAMPLEAVFANAELISASRRSDYSTPTGLHLGGLVHPVGLVLGARERVSGRELLTALTLGYDIACRLAEPAPRFTTYARRPHYIFGPFAAAAVAARLMRLDRGQTADAFSLAASLGMGVVGAGEQDQSHLNGLLARNGVLAALLARAGARSGAGTIDGPNGMYMAFYGAVPEGLTERLDLLGRQFAIMQTSTKRYPGSANSIVTIELMRRLVRASDIQTSDVEKVVITVPQARRPHVTYHEGRLEERYTRVRAESSVRLHVAIVLLDGEIRLERYDQFEDPEVQEAFRKVEVRYWPDPETRSTRVELVARDGSLHGDEAERWPLAPSGDWGAWLRAHGEQLLSKDRIDRLEDVITHLEDVEDVSELAACLVPV